MSISTSDRADIERAGFSSGPFSEAETGNGNETARAVLTSLLALYPVLAAVAVVLVSLSFVGA